MRTHAQAMTLFPGLDLLPPGITDVSAFWSDRPARQGSWRAYAGVARKPAP